MGAHLVNVTLLGLLRDNVKVLLAQQLLIPSLVERLGNAR